MMNEAHAANEPLVKPLAEATAGHLSGRKEGGHAPAASAHGEAATHAAPEHGAAAGHGSQAARSPASSGPSPTLTMEEVISNINSQFRPTAHLLGVKLELELFDDESRALLDRHQAGIRNIVLLTSAEHSYETLGTLAGKLFYKEELVSRVNEFFNKAVVRDIHFASFYMQ